MKGSLTECSICMERMSNPKFLPCHHTFCGECIEKLCRHRSAAVPCPLCRSTFQPPDGASRLPLPTNLYVEELVRLNEIVNEDASKRTGELEVTKNELKASEEGRQKAVEGIRRRDAQLADIKSKLSALKGPSSRVDALRRKLSAAESRKSCLRECRRNAAEQLSAIESRYEAANMETESCRKAAAEAEASLATATDSVMKLEQLTDDAVSRLETEAGRRANDDAEASLSEAEELCRQLRQQLKQTRLENAEKLRDAESRYKAAIDEAENCRKAKREAVTSLETAMRECRRLQQVQRENNNLLKDAERRCKAAIAEANSCQQAKAEAEAELKLIRISYQCLGRQLQLIQRQNCERAKEINLWEGLNSQLQATKDKENNVPGKDILILCCNMQVSTDAASPAPCAALKSVHIALSDLIK